MKNKLLKEVLLIKNKRFWIIIIVLIIFIGVIIKPENKNALVVIDPGHGGKDPGTIGVNNKYEKDIVLKLGKKLRKRLRYKGYKVVLTRDRDEYVELSNRAEIANKLNGDLFLSIHCNAMENNDQIRGVQILYYPDELGANYKMAETLLKNITLKTNANNMRTVERKNLKVLKETSMKSFIIEVGFLSNKEESLMLSDEKYQDLIINGIVKSVEEFYKKKLI